MQIDLVSSEKAQWLNMSISISYIGIFKLSFSLIKSHNFIRCLFLLYSVSELSPHSLHLMAFLVEAPLMLKLEHHNNKIKEKKCSLFHIFSKSYFFNPLQPLKDVHTPSHVCLSSLRSSLVMEARHIFNLTGGEVPGGTRMAESTTL